MLGAQLGDVGKRTHLDGIFGQSGVLCHGFLEVGGVGYLEEG